MLVSTSGGIGEWGFSALVEADGHRVLVDTGGAPDTVLRNAKTLGIDLSTVRDVILTHNHDDHTSGLLALRRSLKQEQPRGDLSSLRGAGNFLEAANRSGPRGQQHDSHSACVRGDGWALHRGSGLAGDFPGSLATGPIARKYPEKNWSDLGKVMTPAGLQEDTIPEDLSLVLDTTRGLVVLTGCGHAGVVNILTQVTSKFPGQPVYGLVGGIHLYRQTDAQLDWTSDKLKGFGVENVLGAHCTGIEAVYHLRQRMGLSRNSAVVGSVGAQFTLKGGIVPGELER